MTDKATGEIFESYSMLTLNADAHPLMSRMHKPDPAKLAPHDQDKRSVIPIELADVDQWLHGTVEQSNVLNSSLARRGFRRRTDDRPGTQGTAMNWKLTINIKGATEEELFRGLNAAHAVLDAGGASPYEAAAARFKLEGEQENLKYEENRLATLWENANVAAAEACCAGWRENPRRLVLGAVASR